MQDVRTDVTDSRTRGHEGARERAGARPTGTQVAPGVTSLTRNEQMVLGTLRAADGPMKAYDLLADLKVQGVRAPMTVYRALDRLEGRGLVHKLDGLGAFVACNQDAPHALQTFLVCDGCAGASEVADVPGAPIERGRIEAVARASGFTAVSARLEIRGRCEDCG